MIRNLVVPLKAKLLMLGAVIYLVSPIDLIPDLLVGPGILDDVLVVPGMFILAMKTIMEATRKPSRAMVRPNHSDR